MKQYSLLMHVARTLISWTASHTLVVWCITKVSQEVLQWIGRPDPRCYGLTQHEYLALLVPVQTDKYLNL